MNNKHLLVFICGAALGLAPLAAGAGEKSKRVDFDGATIKGQTNKGAVHLIERKDAGLGSLVKERKHFRERIVVRDWTVDAVLPADPGLQRKLELDIRIPLDSLEKKKAPEKKNPTGQATVTP